MTTSRLAGQYIEIGVEAATPNSRIAGQYIETGVADATPNALLAGQYIEVGLIEAATPDARLAGQYLEIGASLEASEAILAGQYIETLVGPNMPEHCMIVYSLSNRDLFLNMPQTIRWRSRYRGYKESYKVNTEVNQLRYDILKLRKTYITIQDDFENHVSDLYDGAIITCTNFYWDETASDDIIELEGIFALTLRVQQLEKRIKNLGG